MSDPDYPLTWPEALMAAKDGAVIVDEFPVPNPSTSRGWKNAVQFPV